MKGATSVENYQAPEVVISIHAPVKGATRRLGIDPTDNLISIHAPVKGATTGLIGVARDRHLFQSTPP